MHELSIAVNIVEIASEEAARLSAGKVDAVHLKLGALAGVVKESLLFCWDIASAESPMAGSRLAIEEAPGRELQITALEIEDHDAPETGRSSKERPEA
jgi:hydrogenase nickel incorporation protein HypA/HybF